MAPTGSSVRGTAVALRPKHSLSVNTNKIKSTFQLHRVSVNLWRDHPRAPHSGPSVRQPAFGMRQGPASCVRTWGGAAKHTVCAQDASTTPERGDPALTLLGIVGPASHTLARTRTPPSPTTGPRDGPHTRDPTDRPACGRSASLAPALLLRHLLCPPRPRRVLSLPLSSPPAAAECRPARACGRRSKARRRRHGGEQ